MNQAQKVVRRLEGLPEPSPRPWSVKQHGPQLMVEIVSNDGVRVATMSSHPMGVMGSNASHLVYCVNGMEPGGRVDALICALEPDQPDGFIRWGLELAAKIVRGDIPREQVKTDDLAASLERALVMLTEALDGLDTGLGSRYFCADHAPDGSNGMACHTCSNQATHVSHRVIDDGLLK